jgi:hypothetical protein
MKEANGLLKESLNRLMKKLEKLEGNQFVEFQPIGDLIGEIAIDASPDVESFIRNLVRLSDLLIEVRTKPGSSPIFQDLTVPPYDLWLPFKAEASNPASTEALSKSIFVFSEEIGELASRWRPIAAMMRRAERKPFDQQLVDLCQSINDQFNYCNKSCLDVAQFRLFNPSPEISTELFARTMPSPVASANDFSGFIIAVYNVFDESLPKDIRKRKPESQLAEPLAQVAEILHGESFGYLGTLRNKVVHNNSEPPPELSLVFEKLLGGVRTIARDDGPTWLRLQKAVLVTLFRVLEDVRQIFDSYQARLRANKENDVPVARDLAH